MNNKPVDIECQIIDGVCMSNQYPLHQCKPVDELDEIYTQCLEVKGWPQDWAEAKARLLQWGTRQILKELEFLATSNPTYTHVALKDRIIDYKDELQASLKDGGKTE